jgi:hypothetical protein
MEKKRQKLVEEVAKEENISLISKDKIWVYIQIIIHI